jgi:hypothetical protein
MPARKPRKPKGMSTTDASNAEQRAQVEAQIASAVEAQATQPSAAPTSNSETTALTTQEVRIRNSRNPETERIVARDKSTGKFVKTTTHRAISDMIEAQNYLSSKDDSGLSVKQKLRKHLAETAMTATAEDLNAAVKAAEYLDKEAGYAGMRKRLTEGEESKPGLTIIIDHPILGPVIDWKDSPFNSANQPTKPAFLDAEVVSTNPKQEPKDKVEGQ